MIEKQFDILEKNRQLILKVVNGLTMDQINKIPPGFNNNIAWNFAHLVVTQQLLCYKLSDLECNVDEETINAYRKGSSPEATSEMSEVEFEHFKQLFIHNVDRIKDDYKKKRFKNYNTYTTSVNITLASVEDAISFNNLHEGIHLGSILALRKLV